MSEGSQQHPASETDARRNTSAERPTAPPDSSGSLRQPISSRSVVIWSIAVAAPLALAFAVPVLHKPSPAGPLNSADSAIAWPTQSRQGASSQTPTSANGSAAASVDQLIGGLEQRLQSNPADPKGWALLAQSYAFLGDLERAQSALAQAVALGLDEGDLRQRVSSAAKARAHPVAATPVDLGDADSIDIAYPGR